MADLGDVEKGTPADIQVRIDAAKQFADVEILHRKIEQLEARFEATPITNEKPRKRLVGRLNRAKVEISMAIRRVPFRVNKWKEFTREIERATDEINHLYSEIKKLESRGNLAFQPRLLELKRDLKKRESAASATLPELRHTLTVIRHYEAEVDWAKKHLLGGADE